MRHPPLYLLLIAAAGCTLSALASFEAVPDDVLVAVAAAMAAEVKVAIIRCTDLTVDRGRKVFIEFLANPKLTAVAQASLASSGFELVDTREQADVVYELDGAFQALHPVTRRTAEIRMGDYAEDPALLATKSGRGGSVMLSLNPLATLIGAIASNVGNVAGVQDSMNAAMASDPDGKCLSRCGTWRYRRRNVVNLARKEDSTEQKCSVLTTAEDTELVPARLIQSSPAGLQEAAGLIAVLDLSADPVLAK